MIEDIKALRKLMGTTPEESSTVKTPIYKGVEGITVTLLDYPKNPYRGMYVLATSCWGKKIDKWKETSPGYRFLVVKAVLDGEALPLALESPQFTFRIEGPSRSAFDQIARTRLGVVFSAKGMRDNNWKEAAFRIPSGFSEETEKEIIEVIEKVKEVYGKLVDKDRASWQAARSILPLGICYGWSMSINYQALRNLCGARMKFCEQEDTVATAWLLAKAIKSQFPLLGEYLRPSCDFAGFCQYHRVYQMSEMFGCLFKECGRHPLLGTKSDEYAIFNQSCSSIEKIERELGTRLERPYDWKKEIYFDTLERSDKVLFMEE